MIIPRTKTFSFWENFKGNLRGNPEIGKKILNAAKNGRIDSRIEIGDLDPKEHKEFFKYLTAIENTVKKGTLVRLGTLQYTVYPFDTLVDQVEEGKYPKTIQKPKDDRIVMMIDSEASSNNVNLAYSPSTKEFIIYQASPSFAYIDRMVNAMFGERGFQERYRVKNLAQALKFLNKFQVISTAVYI